MTSQMLLRAAGVGLAFELGVRLICGSCQVLPGHDFAIAFVGALGAQAFGLSQLAALAYTAAVVFIKARWSADPTSLAFDAAIAWLACQIGAMLGSSASDEPSFEPECGSYQDVDCGRHPAAQPVQSASQAACVDDDRDIELHVRVRNR